MIDLIVEAGPQSGQRFELDRPTVIGRGQFADLLISDLAVSRRHARIDQDTGPWRLTDLESANGTRHNGRLVVSPIEIKDGDSIELGQTRLRVRLNDGTAAASLAPAETIEPPPLQPPARTPAPSAAPSLQAPPLVPRTSAANELFQSTIARLRVFSQIGHMLAAGNRSDRRWQDLLALLAEGFPRCDRFALLLADSAQGPWRTLAERASAPLQINALVVGARVAEAVDAGHAMVTLRGLVVTSTDGDQPQVDPAVFAAAPIRHAGQLLGAIYLDAQSEAQAIRAADAEFLTGLGGHVGAMLATSAASTTAMAEPALLALNLAAKIQQKFLPMATPRIDGYELADHYQPAQILSGDLFDYLTLADGSRGLLIADVLGPSIPAALSMARLGAHVRALAPRAKSPSELLAQLNLILRTELASSLSATCLVLALHADSAELRISSAGHAPPIIRRHNGTLETPSLPIAPALGVSGAGQFHESSISLQSGDGLLLFTEGLDEAWDPNGQAFGLARARAVLVNTRSAGQAIEALTSAVRQHRGDAASNEDLCLIAIWRR